MKTIKCVAVMVASMAFATTTHARSYTESEVRKHFSKHPILVSIARCESGLRQYDRDGRVLRGEVDPRDIGVMQINLKYHLKDAEKLGHDIFTLSGNLRYALHLYEAEGLKPWSKSRDCWGK